LKKNIQFSSLNKKPEVGQNYRNIQSKKARRRLLKSATALAYLRSAKYFSFNTALFAVYQGKTQSLDRKALHYNLETPIDIHLFFLLLWFLTK